MTAAPRAPMPELAVPSLAAGVRAALRCLIDLTALPVSVTDGRMDAMLRSCLDGHDGAGPAAAAVRAACAHLAAREYEDTYLALLTAADHLPRRSAGG